MIDRLITWQSKKKHFMKKIRIIPIVFPGVVLLLALIGCPSRQYVHRTYKNENPTKTQYILVSDTHWYSPYALGLSLQEIPDGDNTIYLGDIYDVEYAPKKRIEEVVQIIKQFKLAKGDRYVRGNLVTRPDIVLADEPTANLDSETGEKILGLMRKLNEVENTTFIFSTHDPEVLKYAKNVVKIKDGMIVQ